MRRYAELVARTRSFRDLCQLWSQLLLLLYAIKRGGGSGALPSALPLRILVIASQNVISLLLQGGAGEKKRRSSRSLFLVGAALFRSGRGDERTRRRRLFLALRRRQTAHRFSLPPQVLGKLDHFPKVAGVSFNLRLIVSLFFLEHPM